MHQILTAVSMTAFPCLCTALGAGAVFLARPAPGGGPGQGLAGGVMLAACVFNLLLPAAESGWLAPAAGLVAGAALLLLAERLAGALENGSDRPGRSGGWGAAVAIGLHNLPQGMVVGLAAAGTAGQTGAAAGALALSVGIGLQNLPEGAAVSLPIWRAGAGRWRAFGAGVASGLVEPLGAALAAMLAGGVLAGLMPWLLALAAGVMLAAAVQEPLAAAAQQGAGGVLAAAVGFGLLMALNLALG
ncbi:MAG: ZIP family metal transporter [Fournierella sp.]|uniref:ZIP family metal transporter n=1 Tax=Allofournierella sp. TaxID=1940256 RepID=UPI002A83789D|nr:ZIP family metal transporter [Fournierella sp.]MDY4166443.1 ZIP family metal transporter [Fournierella sp.]